ncbi:hypothetical protein ACIPYV_07755 [Paenarthrobacter nicotinovorans]
MYKPQNIFAATQDLAREWVNHAAEGTSSQTDAVVRWALAMRMSRRWFMA